MAQTRFCSKCGASLIAGADRCRGCHTPVDVVPLVVESAPPPDGKPLVSMWLHPRDTMRGILDNDPTYLVLPLAAVGGVWQILQRLSNRSAGDTLSLPVILAMALVLGPIGGIFGLYIGGWLVHLSGRWIGGEASGQEIRASIAWGSVPTLWGGLFWLPAIAVTGIALFKSALPDTVGPMMVLTAGALGLIQLTTAVWSFVAGLKSLSEAQGFSTMKAFGNLLIAAALLIVPIMILAGAAFVLAVSMRGVR